MEHRQVDIVTAKKSRCRKRGHTGAHGRRLYQTMQTLHSTNLLVQLLFLRRANTQLEARGRSEDQTGHTQNIYKDMLALKDLSGEKVAELQDRHATREHNKRSVEKMLFSDCTDRWNRDSQFSFADGRTRPHAQDYANIGGVCQHTPNLENNVPPERRGGNMFHYSAIQYHSAIILDQASLSINAV